ncbi:hypothetical protein HYQ46_011401 [Verticillium longisporum]|nr:hypothetical protein HYQ46_011401 [Verticillium longisporum]
MAFSNQHVFQIDLECTVGFVTNENGKRVLVSPAGSATLLAQVSDGSGGRHNPQKFALKHLTLNLTIDELFTLLSYAAEGDDTYTSQDKLAIKSSALSQSISATASRISRISVGRVPTQELLTSRRGPIKVDQAHILDAKDRLEVFLGGVYERQLVDERLSRAGRCCNNDVLPMLQPIQSLCLVREELCDTFSVE